MTIQEYLASNGPYEVGLALYAASPHHSANVLRALQRSQNKGTLLYELTKIAKRDKTPQPKKTTKPVAATPQQKKEATQKELIEQSMTAAYPKVIFAKLPKPLQSRFIEQKTAFYKSCQLKMTLNDLPTEDETKALNLIQKIIKLRDFVDTVWKEIDYYTEHGRIMPIAPTNPYDKLEGMEIIKVRQLLYQRKTKRKKTIENLKDKVAKEKDPKRQKALNNRLLKKQEELHQIDLDINHLTNKING